LRIGVLIPTAAAHFYQKSVMNSPNSAQNGRFSLFFAPKDVILTQYPDVHGRTTPVIRSLTLFFAIVSGGHQKAISCFIV
jgi:hypothetical protein